MAEKPLNEFRKIQSETKPKEVHAEGLRRFETIVGREEESRTLGVEDLIFVDHEGGQYDTGIGFLSGDPRTNNTATGSDAPPPPRYQIDRISPVIEESVSDQRESQINIQVRPTAQVEKGLADTFNGIIKNIEIVSRAQDHYDGAYDECQKSGYGGWMIITEYADDSFEQNIRILPIQNATQSLFFGPAKLATKEDALYAFHIWDMDMEEFEAQYPKADKLEWPADSLSSHQKPWFNHQHKTLRIASYWRKRPIKRDIFMLTDGRILDEEDLQAALFEGAQVAVDINGQAMRRTVDSYQVERFIMNGVEVLKGPQKWAGKFIPLIPEYGVRSVVNRREIVRGKVRKGKDAQQIYNYTTSAIVQAASGAPKDFHWMTPQQAEGYTEVLSKMNIDQNPVYFYNPDPEAPGAPTKAQGPTIQQALIEQRNAAKEDITAAVGAGVGVADGTAADNRSGEAILQGNVNRERGNSIYFNNHIAAIEHTGVQLADLISKLWTAEKQERVVKPDGTEEFVTVNQTVRQVNADGIVETVIVNDLSQGRFDVVVDVGPAYASQRQQGADQLTKLATENPAFAQVATDLIAKNLDIPGGDEIHKRLRKAGILGGTIEPTDEEREDLQLDERQQLAAELEPQIREQVTQEANIQLINAQANQLNAQATNFQAAVAEKEQGVQKTAAETEQIIEETEKTQMDKLLIAVEANNKLQQAVLDKMAVGLTPTLSETDNLQKGDDLVETMQHEVDARPSAALQEEFDEGGAPQL